MKLTKVGSNQTVIEIGDVEVLSYAPHLCCGQIDRKLLAELEDGQAWLGYMTKNEGVWQVQNWTGTFQHEIAHWTGNHNWRGVVQHYGWFAMDGQYYIARMTTGGWTEACTVRKLAGKPKNFDYVWRHRNG